MSTLKSFLIKSGLKNIEKKSFAEKLNNYFGFKSFDSKIVTLFNQKGYEVDINNQYLNIYPFEQDYIINYLINEGLKNEYNNRFVNYNKIIFNDDISAITSILNDKKSCEDIYFYFDYEKSIILNKLALRDINYSNYNPDYIQHLFLYNNQENSIKVNNILHITENIASEKIEEYFLNVIETIYNYWNSIYSEDKHKFQLIAVLIEKLLEQYNQEKNMERCMPLVKFIYSMYENTNQFFSNENYYNYPLLKKYSEIYLSIENSNEDNASEHFYRKGDVILLYSRPDFTSFAQEITVKGEVEYVRNISGWDFVKVNGTTGYLPTEALKQQQAAAEKSKHSFLADDDDIKPEKKKGFWGNLFG